MLLKSPETQRSHFFDLAENLHEYVEPTLLLCACNTPITIMYTSYIPDIICTFSAIVKISFTEVENTKLQVVFKGISSTCVENGTSGTNV